MRGCCRLMIGSHIHASIPVKCEMQNALHATTTKRYRDVTKHAKWSIPWMEDDPGLLAPQFWVNRTLE